MNSFPTSPLLEEARHKVRRGKEHLYALDTELQKFWDTKPNTVIHEYDSERRKNLFRLKVQTPAPLSAWALIIGDAVHNARSALDYVAGRLAGSVPDDTRTIFPICESPAKFEEAKSRRLKRVHTDAVTAIGEFQPYLRPILKESAFWLLEELDKRDKHRLRTPIYGVAFNSSFSITDPLAVTLPERPGAPLKDNAVFAEVGGLPNPYVKMNLEFSFDIFLERGIVSDSDDYEVRQGLIKIFDAVDLVIARFDRLLLANPTWIPQS